MGDPFRSDLEAAHRRIEQLEGELSQMRGPEKAERVKKGTIARFALAAMAGTVLGASFMLGSVRARERNLAECNADLDQQRAAYAALQERRQESPQESRPAYGTSTRPAPSQIRSSRAEQIQEAIRQILEREPRPGELDSWTAQAGDARAVRDAIAHSPEVETKIQGLFQQYLGRTAEPVQVAFWTGQLATGTPMSSVRQGVSDTPEAIKLRAMDDCSKPYWYDADGQKHYKPRCLR